MPKSNKQTKKPQTKTKKLPTKPIPATPNGEMVTRRG